MLKSIKCIRPSTGTDKATDALVAGLAIAAAAAAGPAAVSAAGPAAAGATVAKVATVTITKGMLIKGAAGAAASSSTKGFAALFVKNFPGDDQVYLKVNGKKVWPFGSYLKMGSQKIKDVNLLLRIPRTGLFVQVEEYDSASKDDHLGSVFFSSSQKIPFDETGTLWQAVFSKDEGSLYVLEFKRAPPAAVESISQGERGKTAKSASPGYGTGGGSLFSDREYCAPWPITRILVRHGNTVDGIQVEYGGMGAPQHGGTGGYLGVFDVPYGYYVYRIEGRAGNKIDQLQFFARSVAGNGQISHRIRSARFGRGGGKPFVVEFPKGQALSYILGRAGQKLDQVAFRAHAIPHLKSGLVSSLYDGAYYGGRGGNVFSDEAFQGYGAVTGVHISHGNTIDRIQMLYGNSRRGGQRFGGPGGKQASWMVPAGYYIYRIDGRSDMKVDQLQFFACNREGKEVASPIFGGGGGTPFSLTMPGGQVLSHIAVQSGNRLDAIKFVGRRESTHSRPATYTSAYFGGGGGKYFSDAGVFKTAGHVQGAFVWHGNTIDRIQMLYGTGTKQSGGQLFGGSGGRRTDWRAPQGFFIYRIEVRAGVKVDQLQFFATNAAGNQEVSSPVFGRSGGQPFAVDMPAGHALAYIDVQSGKKLDRIRFVGIRVSNRR